MSHWQFPTWHYGYTQMPSYNYLGEASAYGAPPHGYGAPRGTGRGRGYNKVGAVPYTEHVRYCTMVIKSCIDALPVHGTGTCAEGFKEGGGVVGVRTQRYMASYWPTD